MRKKLSLIMVILLFSINLLGCQNKKDLEEAQIIYNALYSDFLEIRRLIYGGKLELGGETVDENDFPYFVLSEENYQQLSDIQILLESAFSPKYISDNLDWVLHGEAPLFKEINNQLCIAMKDAVGESLPEKIQSLKKKEGNIIVIELESEEKKYNVTLVMQEEKWVINQIDIISD